MKFDLSGKRVLVVGASSGIGKAIAEMAAGAGARVAVSARRTDQLKELAATLPGGLAIPGDVRVDGDPARIVAATVEAFGGLDTLIYATGMSPLKHLSLVTLADWQTVLETNIVGAALVAAAAAPHLLEARGRAIVLSSKSVRAPFPDLALYSTSKIALDGLLRCLPLEYPGLEVTRVVVGNTLGTDFSANWDPGATESATQKWMESGVLGSPGMMHANYVAEVVLAAASSRGHIDDVSIIDRSYDAGEW